MNNQYTVLLLAVCLIKLVHLVYTNIHTCKHIIITMIFINVTCYNKAEKISKNSPIYAYDGFTSHRQGVK